MRRPRFYRWIRVQVLAIAGKRSFNLRKLAAQAQRGGNPDLCAALLLYAHENGCTKRLMSYVYDDELRDEYHSVQRKLGDRSIEQLALRGTPMRSLPEEYSVFLEDYSNAFHTPERIAAEKAALHDQAVAAVLRSGTSPAELARQLGVDRANLNAYLTAGETHRVNLEVARKLASMGA